MKLKNLGFPLLLAVIMYRCLYNPIISGSLNWIKKMLCVVGMLPVVGAFAVSQPDSVSGSIQKMSEVSSYCTTYLGGGTFDITAVSITGTTLNNVAVRPAITALDGSYYNSFVAYGTNTCSLTLGRTYTLNVNTYNYDNVSVWIDYNQNGMFDASEWTQVTSNSGGQSASVQITVPANAITGQTGLRIRSNSYYYNNGASNACSNFYYGCTEDYTLTIAAPVPGVPDADFSSLSSLASTGSSIQFSDISTGVPTAWRWTFTGGTPSSSSVQNPSISYSANGVYPVKLVVSNSYGTDSITKTGYVTVTDAVIMPVSGSSFVSANGLTIYDNGGLANYSNNSNGTLTIYPGAPGTAVQLTFSAFNTGFYSDVLAVYNGTTVSASQLGSYSGTSLPPTLTATNPSGALTLKFTSDSYSNYSGFIASATTVPLSMQTLASVSWSGSVDNNQNTYCQSRTLNFTVKNDDSKQTAVFAKIYYKISSGSAYTLMSTSSFVIGANATSATQTYSVSGILSQDIYDFKIELYNSSNVLLASYDKSKNTNLAGLLFETAIEDIQPAYCVGGLGGSSFYIGAVSFTGTTLNNTSVHTGVVTNDGSYYTLLPASGSNTCTLTAGSLYTLNVTTKDQSNVSVWIDYNQDMTFQANEWVQVSAQTNSNTPASVLIIIPNTALTGQTRMRIRTNYPYYTNGSSNACSSFYSGCTEDYTITIVAPVLALPVTDFSASATSVDLGTTIQFYDQTTGAPASWNWTFEGGTPATSTTQYPSVVYNSPGTYMVRLSTRNSMGSDTITKNDYITVRNSVKVPVTGSLSVTSCGTTIYDNGGTSGYANNSNGTLTINPATPGSAVRLQFSEFNTESSFDNLYVYNGASTSATLIGSYSGNSLPGVITATNSTGALTLRFYSDGSTSSSGFTAQASCGNLTSQYINSVVWGAPTDNNYNGYAQSCPLNLTVKNDGLASAILNAKIYVKLTSSTSYTLVGTIPSFVVNAGATSATQSISMSGFSAQANYDVKIELCNQSGAVLDIYDKVIFSALGGIKFESQVDDGHPVYCTSGLGGGSFDISSVSVTATTLNNTATRTMVRTLDGSYYTEFPASGSNTATLFRGSTYTLNVTAKNSDKISVWIDSNRDSLFQSNEWLQVSAQSVFNTPSSVSITIPPTAMLGVTRMRIRTNNYSLSNGSTDACVNFADGCTEDYIITIANPVSSKPVVDFVGSALSLSMGGSVSFSDLTTGIPTSWRWTFSGGTPSSSTVQNPTVVYNTSGTYAVKLVATNVQGADSLTKTGYITVTNTINVPASGTSSITTCDAMIYDNGGTGNYANSTNGTLTVYPGTVGSAVKLQFSNFNIESCCDALYVYNGTSTSATLIGTYTGSAIPGSVRATNASGALTLRFFSDGSSVYSGFAAQAACVPLQAQYIFGTTWTNIVDNNYNSYAQSKVLNIVAYNGNSNSATYYAKVYCKLSTAGTYDLLGRTTNFSVPANSKSEAILYGVSNLPVKGNYDFKVELYDNLNNLLSTYDVTDNSILQNQPFEPVSSDGSASYCTYNLGGAAYDISLVSISGTTLNNNSTRPVTGTYTLYTPSGNCTGTITQGTSYSVNVLTTNNDIVSMWIDYNHNGAFDAAEWTQVTTASNASNASVLVNVPLNSLLGQTRMRIRTRSAGAANYATDACTTFSSGCTEDYLISIESPLYTGMRQGISFAMKLYPNPVSDVLKIELPGFVSGTLQIDDMLGRCLMKKNIAGEFVSEQVSGLREGLYLVTVTDHKGASIKKQVMVQK